MSSFGKVLNFSPSSLVTTTRRTARKPENHIVLDEIRKKRTCLHAQTRERLIVEIESSQVACCVQQQSLTRRDRSSDFVWKEKVKLLQTNNLHINPRVCDLNNVEHFEKEMTFPLLVHLSEEDLNNYNVLVKYAVETEYLQHFPSCLPMKARRPCVAAQTAAVVLTALRWMQGFLNSRLHRCRP
eukprot:200263-Hanusia_phi.AAC.1